jgi:hypothetical protein
MKPSIEVLEPRCTPSAQSVGLPLPNACVSLPDYSSVCLKADADGHSIDAVRQLPGLPAPGPTVTQIVVDKSNVFAVGLVQKPDGTIAAMVQYPSVLMEIDSPDAGLTWGAPRMAADLTQAVEPQPPPNPAPPTPVVDVGMLPPQTPTSVGVTSNADPVQPSIAVAVNQQNGQALVAYFTLVGQQWKPAGFVAEGDGVASEGYFFG